MGDENVIVYELTETQLTSIATSAATQAVEQWSENHACRFDETKERPHIHAFARACETHNMKEDDILVMVFSGKTASTLAKRAAIGVITVLGLIALYIFSGEALRTMGAGVVSFFKGGVAQ